MIGKLKGIVDAIGEDHLILDVGGVGYQVHCSTRTLANLPGPGEALTLWIDTHVRDDAIRLYGFQSELERDWFRLLQTVQGVGARVALAVQSTLSPGDLASAIALQDRGMVARAPGVGPKVASRIVAELRDKAPAYSGAAAAEIGLQRAIGAGLAATPVTDAVSALANLGYSSQQASGAVARALKQAGETADSARLIRLALKELAG
ncbi:MAG: Holliday junction ATP-dependent DNA helicase RuvA [Alphaproteobacteria bacterium]|nr:MAG: Holliday junction ATP-dependent DNA helicase RuvA [Alphaproteobacteria bacterium]